MKVLFAPFALLFLTACAGVQADKMVRHKAEVESYTAALRSPVAFDAASICTASAKLGDWYVTSISKETPVMRTPSGMVAAAACVGIPQGATELRLNSNGVGSGLAFYGTTIAFASTQFLSADFVLIEDFPKPESFAGEGVLSGFAVTSDYDLSKRLSSARYMLIYVNPDSLEGGVKVMDGLQQIWVPYAPYGEFRMRFLRK